MRDLGITCSSKLCLIYFRIVLGLFSHFVRVLSQGFFNFYKVEDKMFHLRLVFVLCEVFALFKVCSVLFYVRFVLYYFVWGLICIDKVFLVMWKICTCTVLCNLGLFRKKKTSPKTIQIKPYRQQSKPNFTQSYIN